MIVLLGALLWVFPPVHAQDTEDAADAGGQTAGGDVSTQAEDEPDAPERIVPTETISPDSVISFPSDI